MVRRLVPTPSLLVAVLALVLCAGGVSYAASRISTHDIRNGAVTSSKIRDGGVRLADLAPAAQPQQGVRAYADVTRDAAFVAARTSGFVTVTRPKTGVFCLTLSDDTLDPLTTAPVVSVDWDNSSGANLAAYLSKSAHGCPTGTDLGVRTFSFASGGDFKPADTVAFTILVP